MKKVLFFLTNNKNLKEICVGSVGLEKGSLCLPVSRSRRELDLRVVHLLDKRSAGLASFDGLNANNLNAVGTGSVTGSHIPVAGSHGGRNCQVTVFTVHVVGTRPRIVSEPDSKVLDFKRFLFSDFFNTDNLAGSFLEFPQLTQEIPKSRFGDNSVWSENSHTVQRSLGFILRWQFTANNLKFTEWSLGLHFYLEL